VRQERWPPVLSSGYTYLGLLMLIALMGTALAQVGMVWHTDAQRNREAELLFAGEELRRAIGSYFESARPSDGKKEFPEKLEDLLEDDRFIPARRHLRRIYRDPMTGGFDWGLVLTPEKRIAGVHTLSENKPIKRTGFGVFTESFAAAQSYAEWKFNYDGKLARGRTVAAVTGVDVVDTGGPLPGTVQMTPVPTRTPPPNPEDEKLKKMCERIQFLDRRSCDAIEAQRDAYAAQPCRDSAARRGQLCLSATGLALPALVTTAPE
jgi:type II secretory pathway pseudopilin PulG